MAARDTEMSQKRKNCRTPTTHARTVGGLQDLRPGTVGGGSRISHCVADEGNAWGAANRRRGGRRRGGSRGTRREKHDQRFKPEKGHHEKIQCAVQTHAGRSSKRGSSK